MKRKKSLKPVVITSISVLIFAFFTAGVLLLSAIYPKIYNTPVNNGCVMDFDGYAFENNDKALMSGEWEFFYNKWIVTDDCKDEPDATIKLPSRWTGMKINGERLTKKGFASYRIYAVNVKAGEKVSVYLSNMTCAYRAFVNGVLCSVSGEVSKNESETFCSGSTEEMYFYTVGENETLEIVIEVSFNSLGGIIKPFWFLFSNNQNIRLSNFVTRIGYTLLGAVVFIILFNYILNFGIYKRNKQISSPLLLTAMLLHLLTTKDIMLNKVLVIDMRLLFLLNYITALVLIFTFLYHLYATGLLKLNKTEKLCFGAVNILSILLCLLTQGSVWQFYIIALTLFTFFYLVHKLSKQAALKKKNAAVHLVIFILLLWIMLAQCMDNLGIIAFGIEAFFSVVLLLIMVCVNLIDFIKIRDSAAMALKSSKLEAELSDMRNLALKSQIKPHFIFNTLTGIQDLYNKNVEAGNIALQRFSQHLRQSLSSSDIVPFAEELKYTMNYFELEKMRLSGNIDLLLDTEFTNFSVPILSLQTLVENALRHGGLEKNEDAYIQISTVKTAGNIILKITDNGCGFDTAQAVGGIGLKNVSERMKNQLSADVLIESEIGCGTTITVIIPDSPPADDLK